jgi:tRNA pseudouridine13 synthase
LCLQVPLKQRLSYVHAYQYFIWNRIISKRFEKFGAQVITGDLVYAQGPRHDQREVIVIDENNIHKYTIYDVVLPLPRHDTIYPANEVAGWYNDLFQADGLSEKDFNLNSKYRI